MNVTFLDRTQPPADLAASLTDEALAILADADMASDSVETELKLWHTLREELERERPWPRSSSFLNKLVHRSARLVAGERQAFSAACPCPA